MNLLTQMIIWRQILKNKSQTTALITTFVIIALNKIVVANGCR
jgi:hypothetical protein